MDIGLDGSMRGLDSNNRVPARAGVESEHGSFAGQKAQYSRTVVLVCVEFGLLSAAFWAVVWISILTVSELTRGIPLEQVTASLPPTAVWVWLGSSLLILAGVSVGMLAVAARDFSIDGSGVHFRSIAYGRQSLRCDQILRPVIARGSLGGVMYFRRGSRTSSVLITDADAVRLSHSSFYDALPVSPQFAKRPELLDKYEARLRSS